MVHDVLVPLLLLLGFGQTVGRPKAKRIERNRIESNGVTSSAHPQTPTINNYQRCVYLHTFIYYIYCTRPVFFYSVSRLSDRFRRNVE